MKEDIFDVLMYLFENYMDVDSEVESLPDSDAVRTELLDAGFELVEISKAFDWLESLSEQRTIKSSTSTTFRIFSAPECSKLDFDCRNLLIFLESSAILNSTNREIVIDRVMALEHEEISVEKLKWIVLMVLLSQPGEEIAFSRMEDIIYGFMPTYLH